MYHSVFFFSKFKINKKRERYALFYDFVILLIWINLLQSSNKGFYFRFYRNIACILLKWEDFLCPKFI
ncbi:hypothetical protein BK387_29660 [Escherichia coli]|nr:hypothetical protein BK387_29660 [Escherichia coli]